MDRGFIVGIVGVGIVMLSFFLFFTASQQHIPPPPPPCICNSPSPVCNCSCNCNSGPVVCKTEAVAPPPTTTSSSALQKVQERYLDTLRDTLTGIAFQTTELRVAPGTTVQTVAFNYDDRKMGKDWPFIGLTMVGVYRLDNIRQALAAVTSQNVPGDFVECGVWRGGASIFAAGYLKIMGIEGRKVWVVDSFGGLPTARTGADVNMWSQMEYLMVSLEKVQTNFRSFNLLDDNVEFVKGYFVDSLPTIKVQKIAVMRMDGDMYESTMDQFFNLFDKISIGGWIIIDDWSIQVCKRAVNDFREWHGITDKIIDIDDDSVYWIKTKDVTLDQSRYTPLLGKNT